MAQQKTSVRTVLEPAREIPVVAEVDVLVLGGGSAGIGAAIAAAREGASTLLVERNSFLGGAATANLLSKWSQHREQLYGLPNEFVDELLARNAAAVGRVINFDPEVFKKTALDKVHEAGASLLFYTDAAAPIMKDGAVAGAFLENKSGRQAVLARTTIDCTGDADLAFRAGAPMAKGREEDGKMRPMALIFRMGNIDFHRVVDYARKHPDQFHANPNWQVNDVEKGVVRISGFFDIVEAGSRSGELYEDCHYIRMEGVDVAHGMCFVNTSRIYKVDGTNASDLTKAEIEARNQVAVWERFIRKHVPGCENAFVVDTAVNMGVRETRRIVGEYVLTEDDIVAGTAFGDRLVYVRGHLAAPGMEVHNPDGNEGSAQDIHGRTHLHPERRFYIPYRCLLPQNVNGLLVAGRCLSASHAADKYTRNQVWCMKMGQAAGTAAAVAAKDGVTARAVNVGRVQARLKAQGAPLDLPA
jgi:hypothetical protein